MTTSTETLGMPEITDVLIFINLISLLKALLREKVFFIAFIFELWGVTQLVRL